jgi:hypothetical protein
MIIGAHNAVFLGKRGKEQGSESEEQGCPPEEAVL